MGEQSYMERVRAALGGQAAPLARDGGRRVLYRCDHCGLPHYQDGAQHHYRLEGAQLAALAAELGADIGALPYATCALCTMQAFGLVELDDYGTGRGLGISWEGTPGTTGYAHIICSAVSVEWARRESASGKVPHSQVVTDYPQARRILAWYAELREPRDAHRLTLADAEAMARDNPPALPGAPGDWRWYGAMWQASCPPVGGAALVSVAQALPVGDMFSLSLCLRIVRRLAELVLAGHIAGERTEGDAP